MYYNWQNNTAEYTVQILLAIFIIISLFISPQTSEAQTLLDTDHISQGQVVFEKVIVVREREGDDEMEDNSGPQADDSLVPLSLDEYPLVEPSDLEEQDTESGDMISESSSPPFLDDYPQLEALETEEEDNEGGEWIPVYERPSSFDNYPYTKESDLTEEQDEQSGEDIEIYSLPPSSDNYPVTEAAGDIEEEDQESSEEAEIYSLPPSSDEYPPAEAAEDIEEQDGESAEEIGIYSFPPFLDNYPLVDELDTEEQDADGGTAEENIDQADPDWTRPNLTPYRPSGWTGTIVVSGTKGTSTDNIVYSGTKAYIDYAYVNNGAADINTRFYTALYINGSRVRTGYMSSLKKNYYAYAQDLEYTFSRSGTYTLKLVCDVNRNVSESRENDNIYQRSKSIGSNNYQKPNLTPYKPSGWSGRIVVSDRTGTHSDSIIYAGTRAYIDYAYVNNGRADISTRFHTALYINGTRVRNAYMNSLRKGYYGYVNDFGYTFSRPGTYTLRLVCDTSNNVSESCESDNTYQRSKSIVTSNYQKPNLTPYKPSGWSGRIVVSDRTGTHSESTIYAGNRAYIDYAYVNNGQADISTRFNTVLYINGSRVRNAYMNSLRKGYYGYVHDFGYTFSRAGTYTLKLICDTSNSVSESCESDNTYQRSKGIGTNNYQKPNLTPYQPSGWTGRIVVSDRGGTHSEGTIYAGNRAYIDYAYVNNGQADISTRFNTALYINGARVRNGYSGGLRKGCYGYVSDFGYTFSRAGTYTLKLVCDIYNSVSESCESDNTYQRNKSIGTNNYQKPNLTPYKPSGWSGRIVVSDRAGTHNDSPVYSGNRAYIDYAYVNNGRADITSRFYVTLHINGTMVRNGYMRGLKRGYYGYIRDFGYTFSRPGTYTLKIVCDPHNIVSESSESDNTYQRSKSVSVKNYQKANLTPYQPGGWTNKIVISDRKGTHSDSTVYAGTKAYIDYAYVNNGQADITSRFYAGLYINGTRVRNGYMPGLRKGYYAYTNDFEHTFAKAGTYVLKLTCDTYNNVSESSETDNSFQRAMSIPTDNQKANLTSYQPSGWSGKIVVSDRTGTHYDTAIYAGKKAYIDYAYVNNGQADISTRFYTAFYINGTRVRNGYIQGLKKGYYAYVRDGEHTFSSPGTYVLKLICDVNNNVPESNENDNIYQRSVLVSPQGGGSPKIRVSPSSLNLVQAQNVNISELPLDKWVPFSEGAASLPQSVPELELTESDKDVLNLQLLTNGMFVNDLEEGGQDYRVTQIGNYNGELPPGQPNLPVVRKYVYVPQGKTPEIRVSLNEPVIFENYVIYPMQHPQQDVAGAEDQGFYIDEAVYNTDDWFPKENAWLGDIETIRGHTMSLLSICPFQYNPRKKILRTFPRIDVNVNFEGQGINTIDSRLSSPVYDQFVRGIVVNEEAVSEYQDIPGAQETGANYLIITAPEFVSQANALRTWKNAKGISTVVKTTKETGRSTQQIKDYIRNAYNTWSPAPTYVLLLGDVEFIPTTYETTTERGTDLYYSTVHGSDYIPDIFLGRISADTLGEAQTVIQKIINYENNPPQSPNFYSNAVVASEFQDSDDNDGYEDRRFVRTSEEIRDFMLKKGYNVRRIYYSDASNPTHYNNRGYGNGEPLPSELLKSNGFNWNGNASDITSAINNGIFLLSHRDHGMDRNDGEYGFRHTGWGAPYFVESHIANLSNGSLLPVIMSLNCESGWFDGETDHYRDRNYESFCELFLRKANGGAVGVFGATRISYSGHNDALAKGLIDCIWTDFLPGVPNRSGAIPQLGPMLNHGKFAMDQIWGDPWGLRKTEYELFHVFGDPSLQMWTSDPGGGGVGKKTFTIYNDGNADLKITSMTKQNNTSWLDFSPKAPFTIPAGRSQTVSVTVDWGKARAAVKNDRILIISNDPNNSPYPNAVYVYVSSEQGKYTLALSKIGNGSVRINSEVYKLPIEKGFYENETVNLEAVADDNWAFKNWSVNGKDMANRQTEIRMDTDKDAVVRFNAPTPHVTLKLNLKEGTGKIKVNGELHELPWNHSFEKDSKVTVEAFPADDFSYWSGALGGSNPVETVRADSDKDIFLAFKKVPSEGWKAVIHAQGEVLDGVQSVSFYEWQNQPGADENVLVNSYEVTIGIDSEAKTEEAAPDPPEFSVSMKLWTTDWQGPFFKEIHEQGVECYKWILAINPHGNAPPPTPRDAVISWNPSEFCQGDSWSYQMRKGYDGTGEIVVADMCTETSHKVSGDDSSQYFTIEFCPGSPVEMVLKKGWNLISLPVSPNDSRLKVLFPDAIVAYKFDKTYQQVSQLNPGMGYWIKIPDDRTYKISGEKFASYSKNVSKGWHLLGAVYEKAGPDPADKLSAIYGFSSSYFQASEFEPGKGYWVKVTEDCQFTVNAR